MSDLARLAASIERTNDITLLAQLRRHVELSAPIGNQFALANLLLSKKSLETRIRSLSKADLAKLIEGKSSESLRSLWLADENAALDAAVNLASELLGRTDVDSIESSEQGFEITAYDSVRCLTEICYSARRTWLKTSSRGLKASDARQLALRLQLPEVVVVTCSQLLVRQGLLVPDSQSWVTSSPGADWLELNFPERWFQVASAALSDSVLWQKDLNLRVGEELAAKLKAEYPLLRSGVGSLVEATLALGLTVAGKVTPLLVKLPPADAPPGEVVKLLGETMPSKQPKVIVQSDLTILVTGPLTAGLWGQLNSFTEALELGTASIFRINLASVIRALQAGWSASAIANLLAELSGREVPQPLNFLLRDAERRFGELEVTVEPVGCSVRSRDAILIAQIQNEPSLAALRLRGVAERILESALSAREVGLALRSAGYPALLPPSSTKQMQQTGGEFDNRASEWLQAIRAGTESEESTREQLLQFALRDAIPLRICYRGPSGETTVLVRVLGVTPQRIRCREIGRDAELTLPQSSIREISIGLS